MKNLKKLLAIFLSIAMVMCSTLPSLASETETTVGASEEIVESSTEETSRGEACEPEEDETDATVGDDILSSQEEESESTVGVEPAEDVGASTASPEIETESTVGDDILSSQEEESESTEETESTVGDDILSSHDEETDSTVGVEPAEDVGASTASPEEESESTEETVGAKLGEPAEEADESVGASTASPEEESTSTDETTLEETTLEETTAEDTTESLKELKATKSEIVSEEKLLGDPSTTWMCWWFDDSSRTMYCSSPKYEYIPRHAAWVVGDHFGYPDIVKSDTEYVEFIDQIDALNCRGFFENFGGLVEIINIKYLNTENVKNMERMFYGCISLKDLDLSNFNTLKVTNMSEMFMSCYSLEKIIASDNFVTTAVEESVNMFYHCGKLTGTYYTRYQDVRVANYEYARIDKPGSPGYFSYVWMWWYLEGTNEIHFSGTEPSGKSANAVSIHRVKRMTYNGLSKENIEVAVFDNEINAISCYNFFDGFTNLNTIKNIDNFKTNYVTKMAEMFRDCNALEKLDLSSFDTTRVNDMSRMFENCSSLTKIIVSNSFKTTSVTYYGNMFFRCTNLVGGAGTAYDRNHDDKEYARIDKPGTPGYFTDVNWMYWWMTNEDGGGFSETIHFSSYDPGGVGAKPITGTGAISYDGISSRERSNITKAVFEDEIEAETCEELFYEFFKLESIENIKNLKTSNVTNMSKMFYNCRELTDLDVTGFNTSKVTDMSRMFRGCSTLLSLDLSKFITDSVVDMSYMFKNCIRLSELELKSFKVDNVETMEQMFYGCYNLKKLDITSFTPNKVYSFDQFLCGCINLNNIDFSGLDTSSAETMVGMFFGCNNLTKLDLSGFNTEKVRDMKEMFYDCINLQIIDLSNFNTKEVTEMSKMFYRCDLLEKVIVSEKFVTSNVIESDDMFFGCTNLVGGAGTTYDRGHTSIEYAHIDGGSANPGYFSNSPWAYWQLSDGNKTIHYTYAKPASGDYGTVTRTDQVVYDNLTKQDITKAVFEEDINPVTCEGFFESFTNLKSIEGLEKLRTVDVKNMKRMFFECSELEKLDLKHFNTSNVELMEQMFSGCNKLVTITVADHLVTTSVTDDGVGMFENCTSLVGGNGTKFDASHTNKAYARADKKNTQGYFTGTIFESISINTPPQNTVYNVGDTLDPSGLKIDLNYDDGSKDVEEYNSQTAADFTFRPSLGTALALTDRIVTVTYDGKSTTFAIEVKQSGGGGVTPKPGGNTGGSSSGSSGGGGGGGPTIAEDVPKVTYLQINKVISGIFTSVTSKWESDPLVGNWKLSTTDAIGNSIPVTNGFYIYSNIITHIVNGVSAQTQVNDTFCFDTKGNMITGWVRTLDGKWYFFEHKKNSNEGKMIIGWKQIQGSWYCFGPDGAMYVNTVTPDGYRVGPDGKWIQ